MAHARVVSVPQSQPILVLGGVPQSKPRKVMEAPSWRGVFAYGTAPPGGPLCSGTGHTHAWPDAHRRSRGGTASCRSARLRAGAQGDVAAAGGAAWLTRRQPCGCGSSRCSRPSHCCGLRAFAHEHRHLRHRDPSSHLAAGCCRRSCRAAAQLPVQNRHWQDRSKVARRLAQLAAKVRLCAAVRRRDAGATGRLRPCPRGRLHYLCARLPRLGLRLRARGGGARRRRLHGRRA